MGKNQEWIKRTLAHKESPAVPYNFMLSPPSERMVLDHYGGDSVEDALNFPIRMSGAESIKPLYASPEIYGETITDEFGVIWSTNYRDRGSPIEPCLDVPDLSRYTFPDPSLSYRFEKLGKWCDENKEHFTIIWVGDLWERATFMRGMENILEDLVLNPGFVEALLRGICDYILGTMDILFQRFRFDGIAVSDDYGTQRAMIMSPSHWNRFIKPCLADIYSQAKAHGKTVFHHSCGNILPIIKDMIDIGLDILHPIQPEAMDVFELKKEYGTDLSFCGGVRTQDLLPFGTPEDVRKEVRKLVKEMGRGGGYILEPGITIQADVPLENLVAMIDEVREIRRHA